MPTGDPQTLAHAERAHEVLDRARIGLQSARGAQTRLGGLSGEMRAFEEADLVSVTVSV